MRKDGTMSRLCSKRNIDHGQRLGRDVEAEEESKADSRLAMKFLGAWVFASGILIPTLNVTGFFISIILGLIMTVVFVAMMFIKYLGEGNVEDEDGEPQ